jgi:hypothetical protein
MAFLFRSAAPVMVKNLAVRGIVPLAAVRFSIADSLDR